MCLFFMKLWIGFTSRVKNGHIQINLYVCIRVCVRVHMYPWSSLLLHIGCCHSFHQNRNLMSWNPQITQLIHVCQEAQINLLGSNRDVINWHKSIIVRIRFIRNNIVQNSMHGMRKLVYEIRCRRHERGYIIDDEWGIYASVNQTTIPSNNGLSYVQHKPLSKAMLTC